MLSFTKWSWSWIVPTLCASITFFLISHQRSKVTLFSMWSLIHFVSALDAYLFTVELGLGCTYLCASFTFFFLFLFPPDFSSMERGGGVQFVEIESNSLVQIEWEDAHRLARRHMEREQGRKDATADMSSDLSEGEKESTPAETMPRVESSLALAGNAPGTPEKAPQEPGEKRLYIVLIRYTINKFEPVF